ncbi:unnamed protein product, partial [Nesidiocoris tenuis]
LVNDIYLQTATIGIHMTDREMRTIIRTIDQAGHSFITVSPVSAIQAGYRLPSKISSAKLAISIIVMAAGDRYFQQMSQYSPGRLPVISSMSSANLKLLKNKK